MTDSYKWRAQLDYDYKHSRLVKIHTADEEKSVITDGFPVKKSVTNLSTNGFGKGEEHVNYIIQGEKH